MRIKEGWKIRKCEERTEIKLYWKTKKSIL
jgi:hypothetical protein